MGRERVRETGDRLPASTSPLKFQSIESHTVLVLSEVGCRWSDRSRQKSERGGGVFDYLVCCISIYTKGTHVLRDASRGHCARFGTIRSH